MSGGDRWGELSRLVAACLLERPERVDEVALADLAGGWPVGMRGFRSGLLRFDLWMSSLAWHLT